MMKIIALDYLQDIDQIKKTSGCYRPEPTCTCRGIPEFKVKVRSEKDRIKELQGMVKQLKKEKAQVEQWNARQQEKIQDFKKKRKEQKALLKELRESNFRLYWHNIVLTTKLKQRNTKASAIIIP
jgi:predicted RNase H-like nuclease (RuvC/YqgF family)